MANPEELNSVEAGEQPVETEAEENERAAYRELLESGTLFGPEVKDEVIERQAEYAADLDELKVVSERQESTLEEPPDIKELYEMLENHELALNEEEGAKAKEIGEGLSNAEGLDHEAMVAAQESIREVGEPVAEEEEENAESLRERMRAVGASRMQSLVDKAALLAAPDVLVGAGVRKAKELAAKSSKGLARIGLSPFAAVENAARKVKGTVDVGIAGAKSAFAEIEAKAIQDMTPEQRSSMGEGMIERIMNTRQEMNEKRNKAVERFRKKGFLARMIENLST